MIVVMTTLDLAEAIECGEVVCFPLDPARINNSSIDVSLGRWAFRLPQGWAAPMHPEQDGAAAVFVKEDLEGKGLRLRSGERVLVHTHEFVGGRTRTLPEMRAKSSTARWGLTVCACAGFGDVGFINRWTMEVMNLNPGPILIPVGSVIAQIVFNSVRPPPEVNRYGVVPGRDQYQQGPELVDIVRTWEPESMLPKRLKVSAWKPVCPGDLPMDGV